MSLVAHYEFLDPSNLGLDSSGNGLNATNTDVTQVTDPERGIVASFNGTTSFLETISDLTDPIGTSNRTYMAWIKNNSTAVQTITSNGGTNDTFKTFVSSLVGFAVGTSINSTPTYTVGEWTHVAFSTQSTSFKTYVDGVQRRSTSFSSFSNAPTTASPLFIGTFNNSQYFTGLMADVRIYNYTASAAEILSITQLPPSILFGLTPSSTIMEAIWLEVAGAVSYRLTIDSGSGESIVGDQLSSTEQRLYNLVPEASYTFRLYYSLDGSNYVLRETVSSTMLSDTEANSNLSVFFYGTSYNLSVFNDSTRSILEVYLTGIASNGDIILINSNGLQDKELWFVTGGSTSQTSNDALIIPFNGGNGPSQTITLELSDTSSVVVNYDETTDEINISGTSYSDGDVFVLDGK